VAITATAGAIIAIFFYDYRIALAVWRLLSQLLIKFLNRKKVTLFQKDIHDNQEELFH